MTPRLTTIDKPGQAFPRVGETVMYHDQWAIDSVHEMLASEAEISEERKRRRPPHYLEELEFNVIVNWCYWPPDVRRPPRTTLGFLFRG